MVEYLSNLSQKSRTLVLSPQYVPERRLVSRATCFKCRTFTLGSYSCKASILRCVVVSNLLLLPFHSTTCCLNLDARRRATTCHTHGYSEVTTSRVYGT